jgi:hypothetical protein
MAWFKIDDSFHSHPKVLAATPAALGLWVVAGAWCSSNLTDGLVPDYVLPRLLADSAELAKQLVTVGLWRRTKGGFLFHDWLDYNPSAASVKAEREAAKKRMRELREKRGANDETAGQTINGSGEQDANVRAKFGRRSQPRPDPTRGSSKEEPSSPQASPSGERAKRATRIPDDFTVTPEMRVWAAAECPLVVIDNETKIFIDHWKGTAKNPTKVDWLKTWQVWMRKEQKALLARFQPRPGNRLTGADSRDGKTDWDNPQLDILGFS